MIPSLDRTCRFIRDSADGDTLDLPGMPIERADEDIVLIGTGYSGVLSCRDLANAVQYRTFWGRYPLPVRAYDEAKSRMIRTMPGLHHV